MLAIFCNIIYIYSGRLALTGETSGSDAYIMLLMLMLMHASTTCNLSLPTHHASRKAVPKDSRAHGEFASLAADKNYSSSNRTVNRALGA